MGCWDSFDRNTPKVTINNMTLDEIKKAVKAESKWLKLAKLISAIVVAITATVCMSYFVVDHKNVVAIQDNCEVLAGPSKAVYCSNSTLYDFAYAAGPYSDETNSKEYLRRLGNCDTFCQTQGLRWSYIYILGAVAMCTFVFQSIILALGVFLYPFRMTAILCQPLFCLNNLGAVIVTAIFRFNIMGKLASISEAPALYKSVDGVPTLSADRTYADDGQLILRLWIVSMIFVTLQCVLGCFSAAPPTQDKLRKWGVDINEELNEDGQHIVTASL